MGIASIAKRSNKFVAGLKVFVAQSVENSEEGLVILNRDQMLRSLRADGQTISPPYSEPYARKKGRSDPNLIVKGEFQDEMFLSVNENDGTFFLSSFDFKMRFLVKRYGIKIFGIMPANRPKAQKLTTAQLTKLYYSFVFNA